MLPRLGRLAAARWRTHQRASPSDCNRLVGPALKLIPSPSISFVIRYREKIGPPKAVVVPCLRAKDPIQLLLPFIRKSKYEPRLLLVMYVQGGAKNSGMFEFLPRFLTELLHDKLQFLLRSPYGQDIMYMYISDAQWRSLAPLPRVSPSARPT